MWGATPFTSVLLRALPWDHLEVLDTEDWGLTPTWEPVPAESWSWEQLPERAAALGTARLPESLGGKAAGCSRGPDVVRPGTPSLRG